jgi:hypothetical protein
MKNFGNRFFVMVGAIILFAAFTVTAQMGGGRGQGRMMGGPFYKTGAEVRFWRTAMNYILI